MTRKQPENISRSAAREMLQCGWQTLELLILRGHIREIVILNRRLLKRADVERVVRDGTEPVKEAAE